MPLYLSRRPAESVSVYCQGERILRVTVMRGGGEPLLKFEAPPELQILRDELVAGARQADRGRAA